MPAKKKQASLKKTKNTTTYRDGGELPQARYGAFPNQAQFDDLRREEINARDGAGNEQQIFRAAVGGELDYQGDIESDLASDSIFGDTEYSRDGGQFDRGGYISDQILRDEDYGSRGRTPGATMAKGTGNIYKKGGSVKAADAFGMGGMTSAFRYDWNTPCKDCK